MICQLTSTIRDYAKLLAVGAICAGPLNAHADWLLVNKDSQLNFISIKVAHIAEQHSFDTLSGAVKEDGSAHLSIDLASVKTGIEIRDQRMRDLLFKVADFPRADFNTVMDLDAATALAVGERTELSVRGTLRLQDISADLETEVTAVKLADNRVMVTTNKPVLLNASPLGLADGVEQLRAIAKLPGISLAVPVTFQLLFEKTP